jgi:hypothetical protein
MEQALDSCLERLNQDVQLLQMGRDYWKEIIQRHMSENNTNITNQPTLHNQKPEVMALSDECNVPTDQDDYRSYFEKLRNLLGKRNQHNNFIAKTMADQEMLRREVHARTTKADRGQSDTISKCPTRKSL